MANIGNIGGPHGRIPQKAIDNKEAAQSKQAGKSGEAPRGATEGAPQLGDRAEINRETLATLLDKAREAFDRTPAVREDVVARVRELYKNGYYNRPEVIEALAEGLARGLRNE